MRNEKETDMTEDTHKQDAAETPAPPETPARKRPPRITALTLENFKCFSGAVRIPLGDITLLFGPNSAGKSSIIQALHFLRKVLLGQDLDVSEGDSEASDVGTFRELIHKHDLAKTMRIGVEMTAENRLGDMYDVISRDDHYTSDFSILEEAYCAGGWMGVDVGDILPRRVCLEAAVSWSSSKESSFVSEYNISADDAPFLSITCPDDDEVLATVNNRHAIIQNILSGKTEGMAYNLLGYDDGRQSTPFSLESADAIHHLIFDLVDREVPDTSTIYPDLSGTALPSNCIEFFLTRYDLGFRSETDRFLTERIRELEEKIGSLSSRLSEGINESSSEEDAEKENSDEAELECQRYALQFTRIRTRKGRDITLDAIGMGAKHIVLKALADLRHLGPLRHVPARNFIASPLNRHGRWYDGRGAWDELFDAGTELLDRCTMHLRGTLDCPYRLYHREVVHEDVETLERALSDGPDAVRALLKKSASRRVQVRDERHGVNVELPDIGTGLSQLIPVVVGAVAEGASLLAVQEPELHAHPALQARLADVFLHERDRQPVLLETHSEHLILRLLRRIRETSSGRLPENFAAVRPKDVRVIYLKPAEDGTEVHVLDITDGGDFINDWPDGFFMEREEELF